MQPTIQPTVQPTQPTKPAGIAESYRLRPLGATFALFMLIAIVGSIFTPTRLGTMLSLMFGLFCYLILPGYVLLLNLELDDLERIILSTAVGISLLPLIFFNLSLFWIKMKLPVVVISIIAVTALGIALKEREAIIGHFKKGHEKNPDRKARD
jgi:uncharacterized membrane protein